MSGQTDGWFLQARGCRPGVTLGTPQLLAKQLISLLAAFVSFSPRASATGWQREGSREAVDQLIVLNLSTQILLSP